MSDAGGDTAETKKRDYLKDEYLKLLDNYESFDSRSLTIKGWVATGAVTALAISFGKDLSTLARVTIPAFVVILSATFWGLEAGWKLFQANSQNRIRTIEAYFRGDPNLIVYSADGQSELDRADLPALQTYNSWNRAWDFDLPVYRGESGRGRTQRQRFFAMLGRLNVALPYAVIIVLALAAAGLGLLAGAPAKPAQACAVTIQVADPSFTPSAVKCSLR